MMVAAINKKLFLVLCVLVVILHSRQIIAQGEPISGLAQVNLDAAVNGIFGSQVNIPVNINLTAVSATNAVGGSVNAVIGNYRFAVSYDNTQLKAVLVNGMLTGGSTAEFFDAVTAKIISSGTNDVLIFTASQLNSAIPTGMINVAQIPFEVIGSQQVTTAVSMNVLDLRTPIVVTGLQAQPILGGAAIPFQVTGTEINIQSASDTDNDLIPDVYELANGLNPLDPGDATSDYDADGLTALEEFNAGTRADLRDSDFDGDSDLEELTFGTDPNNPLDNINAHRPYPPVLIALNTAQDVNNVLLQSSVFSDPDLLAGDVINADQWQLSDDVLFNALVLDRTRAGIELTDNGTTFLVLNGLLQTSRTYYFRAKHQDITGLWSDWSAAETINTLANNALDADHDGVADLYQVLVPTDVNNNSIDDSLEGIRVIYEAVNGEMVGFDVSSIGNPPGTTINSLSAIDVADLPAGGLLLDKVVPYGMFRFTLDSTSVGIDALNPVSVDVTLHFPAVIPPGTTWIIFDTVTNQLIDYTDHVTFFENTATLSLTDGGLGDLDKVINGYILDSGGPVLPATDSDADGIVDNLDNCINVASPAQLDTEADGFGNICDADLNGDLTVDLSDFSLFRIVFATADPDADFNGDGTVDLTDFSLFRVMFGSPPGPSGLNP
jgi:hypothetical protein